jgi:hypothetical protein
MTEQAYHKLYEPITYFGEEWTHWQVVDGPTEGNQQLLFYRMHPDHPDTLPVKVCRGGTAERVFEVVPVPQASGLPMVGAGGVVRGGDH